LLRVESWKRLTAVAARGYRKRSTPINREQALNVQLSVHQERLMITLIKYLAVG
jgi:hypothetical protein